MNAALDRDAIYYPYYFIQDVNWLKATLLAFPQLRTLGQSPINMVSGERPDIAVFRQLSGSRGEPLLAFETTTTDAALRAQRKLIEKINQLEDVERYTRQKAVLSDIPFTLYRGRISDELLDTLLKRNLAWLASVSGAIRVHFRLGMAMMATVIVAVANDKGLDVVTPSQRVHHAVVTQEEDDIFDEILGINKSSKRGEIPVSETLDDLVETIMTTFIDVSRLTAEQIAELHKEGKDLRRFKERLLPLAATIPSIHSHEEREKRLKLAAEEVIEEWQSYKKTLPRFFIEALIDTQDIKAPELSTGLLGAVSSISGGLAAGIGVFLVTYSGLKIWRKYKENVRNPYQYLSRLEKRGASLALPPARMLKQ